MGATASALTIDANSVVLNPRDNPNARGNTSLITSWFRRTNLNSAALPTSLLGSGRDLFFLPRMTHDQGSDLLSILECFFVGSPKRGHWLHYIQ